jgi:hypothetical protein
MALKSLTILLTALLLLAGCAQNETSYAPPERDDPAFLKGKNTRADELYLNTSAPAGGRDYRDVYIAPVNFETLQVVPPADAPADEGWVITDDERDTMQAIIQEEFTRALGYESAFNVVDSAAAAEIVVSTRLVAIHPHGTRAEIESGAKRGGAITASLALRDAKSGEVLVRSVDTRSTDDIWAFNQMDNEEGAISLIFRSWGNSIRRGILVLQGRSSDPLAPAITVKEQ